jgi:hypothetical protein
MPRRKSKKKPLTDRKKYCHCTPFCNKKLTQQARRLHYKRLKPEQLDAVRDSAVSDYSSISERFSDVLQALEAPTTARKSNSVKDSSSDENIHQFGYDGTDSDSEEVEKHEPVEDEETRSGYTSDEESGYTSKADEGGGVQDEKGHFYRTRSEGEESGSGSGESEGEALEEDLWSDQGSEFDEWKAYHEDDEAAAFKSDEERLHEFEDILEGPAEHAELWESRLYFTFSNLTFLIIHS